MTFLKNDKIIENFIHYGILAILSLPLVSPLFLAPFGLFLFPDSFAKAIVFRIIVEILFIASLYVLILRNKQHFSFSRRHILLLFFGILWFVIGIATTFSLEVHQSMWDLQYRSLGFFFYSHLFVFLFLLIYFVKSQKLWDRILKIMIIVAGIVSLLGILQWFGIYLKADYIEVTGLTRPGATLGNPNTFGAYLVILLPITFLYFLKSLNVRGPTPHIKSSILFGAIFILEIIGLFAGGSRAAFLGFLVSIVLFIFLYPFKKSFIKKIIWSILIFFILFSALGTWSGFLNNILVFQKLSHPIANSGLTRLTSWQSGLKSFLDKPLLGFGPENFAIAFDRNYNPFFGNFAGLEEHWWGRAHNFVVEWLTTIGIIGFAAYTLIYGFIFSALYRIIRRKNEAPCAKSAGYLERNSSVAPQYCGAKKNDIPADNEDPRVTSAILISLFSGYFTYNFFNFDVPVNLVMLFVIFGYTYFIINKWYYSNSIEADKRPVSQASGPARGFTLIYRYAIFIPMLISVLFLLWNYNLKPFFINVKANEIESRFFANPEKSFNDYLEVLDKSSYIDHDLNLRFYFNAHKYTNLLMQKGQNDKVVEKRKILIEKLENNLIVKPFYTRNHLFLGDSYTYLVNLEKDNKTENFIKARNHYLKAIELSPKRQEGHIGLSQLYRTTNQFDKSIAILKDIIALNDAYGPAHFWLAINYFYKNEIEQGKEELKKALKSGYKLPLGNLELVFKDNPETLKKIIEDINKNE